MNGEKESIYEHFKDLPEWVRFPDKEKAEWLNNIFKQIWPKVNHYARELVSGPIEQSLRASIKGFKFDRIVLGNIPFRLGGVVVHEPTSREQIVMDVDLDYAGDCDITCTVSGVKVGIKNFQLYGKLRIAMKPLISTIPLIGGIEAFFFETPEIDFDLVGMANILDTPGLKSLILKTVKDIIRSIIVLPNKYIIQLSANVDASDIKIPEPQGVLRIHVIEAKDLMKKDFNIMGTGKSDPYAVLRVGTQEFKTKVIDNTVQPVWNEWFEFFVMHISGQELYGHLWDHDNTGKDESLGLFNIDISTLVENGVTQRWITLDKARHGSIHLKISWLPISKNPLDLDAALAETQMIPSLNTAILSIFVDSANNLPQIKKHSNPNPYVTIRLGQQKHFTTKVLEKNVNPVWEESTIYLVNNPQADKIILSITDEKTDTLLGELTYNLNNLLNEPGLEILKAPFSLAKSNDNSNIVVSFKLWILKHNIHELSIEDTKIDEKKPLQKQNSEISNKSLNNNNNFDSDDKNDSSTIEERHKEELDNNSRYRSPSISSYAGAEGLGLIYLSLRYSSQRQMLIVVVHKVANIPVDYNNLPDLYVKGYLLPERSKDSKRKTKIIKNAVNPTFDEQFEYLISSADLETVQLQILVIEDKKMKNYTLGQVIINLGKFDLSKTVTQWFDLTAA